MRKPEIIQLNVANPCHEDWATMTPKEQGRFCGQCQKTVIDFTNWSDTDLFGFFANPGTGSVCGRFLRSQLQKELYIPPQPKSRLYRIAIACGLTLMFTQVPEMHAMVKHPVESLSSAGQDNDGEKDEPANNGIIRGKITDENKAYLAGAVVEVRADGTLKGSATTDENGRYIIKGLAPGAYRVSTIYIFSNSEEKIVTVSGQKETVANFSIERVDAPVMGLVAPPIKGEVSPVTPIPEPQPEIRGKVKVRK